MNNKCLLVKTKNRRRFLTHEKNLAYLIEFAKTFQAEIYLVQPEQGQKLLELKPLTVALCASEYTGASKYAIINRIFPKSKRNRQDILAEAEKIRAFIKKKLMAGKPLSLKELKSKYKANKLTDACLCNQLPSPSNDTNFSV
jgi:hypothetical protein